MTTRPSSTSDNVARLLASLRASEDELAALRKLEAAGKTAEFAKALNALDKKYKDRSLHKIKALDKKLINPQAFRTGEEPGRSVPVAANGAVALIAQLLNAKEVVCDCLVPFSFAGLRTFGSMSGPDVNEVTRGLLGAVRYFANEYTVFNPGDTQGKTRVPLYGQMHLSFSAELPQAGRYCLLMPTGPLWVRGYSQVVGHGNFTTSYDAKVWVDYYQVLEHEGTLLEISGGGIHYDGTRSEDRTTYFNHDLFFAPRYIFFNAARSGRLLLTLRLEVDAEANEDGLALGVVNYFGFPANTKRDYDTFIVRTS